MIKESKSLVKKAAKIAGFTCVALGGAAVIASGAALKALGASATYLKESIRKTMNEKQETANSEISAEVGLCDPK